MSSFLNRCKRAAAKLRSKDETLQELDAKAAQFLESTVRPLEEIGFCVKPYDSIYWTVIASHPKLFESWLFRARCDGMSTQVIVTDTLDVAEDIHHSFRFADAGTTQMHVQNYLAHKAAKSGLLGDLELNGDEG